MRIGLGRNGHPKNTHKIQKVSIVIKQKGQDAHDLITKEKINF